MSAFHDNVLMGASGSQGYTIARSVRLRSSASAYFNRTFTTPTDGKKWTYSFWIKRGSLTTNQPVLTAYTDANNQATLYHTTGNKLYWLSTTGGSTYTQFRTDALYRDPSAWYHFVVVFDSTNATSTDRIKMYVNGTSLTCEAGQYIAPALNTTAFVNTAIGHRIGNDQNLGIYLDGYLTEINFIDGQALTPSSFGETDSITGVWKAKKYSGTYGTNGFYLNFSDNSNNTATTIGKDYSGNGNNWTPNNISVTSGVTYDSMIDVPTLWGDGSTNRGNYATLNPLLGTGSTYNPQVPTNGNLNIGGGSSKVYSAATITMTSEKWYAEFSITLAASGYPIIGVWSSVPTGTDAYPGHINSTGVSYEANGSRDVNGTNTPSWAATFTTNDIIGVACDANTGKVWFSKNGTWLASGDPANGTTPAATLTSGTYIFGPCASASSGATLSANFGQRPFSYTPPTGFVALNTNNLPVPTIKNGAGYMAATLYTGNGSTQSISNAVNGTSFQPDLVWVKGRSVAYSHGLYDSVRGVNKRLISNLTNAEDTLSGVSAFSSGGFSLGSDINFNQGSATYVGWQWKANGSAVTNTAGSITSQVNAGATQGFSVVTYTGTGANATVGHGLGVAPSMIIVKRRDFTGSWLTYHGSLGATKFLTMESTSAAGTSAAPWNNTAPTSSVFSLGTGNTNDSGGTFVAYCFAAVAGFSAFGSYLGNGSADGPFVFTGFRPRFVMFKCSSDAGTDWVVYDSARNEYNVMGEYLLPNLSNAGASNAGVDFLSNGFKIKLAGGGSTNTTGRTYIYAAFSEVGFKYALGR